METVEIQPAPAITSRSLQPQPRTDGGIGGRGSFQDQPALPAEKTGGPGNEFCRPLAVVIRGIGQDQVIQGDGAKELVFLIHDKDSVEVLHFPALTPDFRDGLASREFSSDPYQEGVHQPTGGFVIVPKEAPNLSGLLQGKCGENLGPLFGLELPYQVNSVIDLHLVKKFSAPFGMEGGQNHFRVILLVHLGKSLGSKFNGKNLHESHSLFVRVQGLHQICHITGVELMEEFPGCVHLPGLHQFLEGLPNAFDVLKSGSCQWARSGRGLFLS